MAAAVRPRGILVMKKQIWNRWAALVALIATAAAAAEAASLPNLTDTINPLPGPGCYGPYQLAVNNITKRVYVVGNAAGFGLDGVASVIDAQSKQVLGAIKFPVAGHGVVLNEATNRIYFGTTTNDRLFAQITVVDGATNQITGNFPGDLGREAYVDPNTGRIFAIRSWMNGSDTSVRVYDGTTLTLLQTIVLEDNGAPFHASMAGINPGTRKLYVSGGTSSSSGIGVVNLDSLTLASVLHPPGAGGNIVVDPGTNKLFATGVQANGSGGNTPVVVVLNSSSDAVIATIPLTQDDYGITGGPFVGVTVDTTRHRAYFSEGFYPNPVAQVIDTQNNTSLGTLAGAWFSSGGVLTSTGEIFATQTNPGSFGYWALEDAIGVVNPSTGAVTKITTGYLPYVIQANPNTNRFYVNDQVGNDILVFNSDHSLAARVTVGRSTDIAVSAALNRIYSGRTSERRNDGTVSLYLDVIDGNTNQVAQTITVVAAAFPSTPFVAVDDSRHRVYVTGLDANNDSRLFVFDSNTNTATTNVPVVRNHGAIGVDPVSGRIYIPNRDHGFGEVQVLDPTSLTQIALPSAGAVPGPMAFDAQHNKLYVANIGAGSVDNSITVINTATNTTETTFSNGSGNGHAITCVAVNSVTNTVFGGDDSNGSAAHGFVSGFDGANNYSIIGQRDLDGYPVRMLVHPTTRELLVSSYSGTINVFGTGAPPAPPVPPHGGLSATVFRINNSQSPTGNLADTALHFSAQQSGTPQGLVVRVQINTVADNNRTDWVNLNNGSGQGYMTIDKTTGQFVLSSTNYPNANNLYFRALSSAPGYPDSKSNIIGPLNLAYGQGHLSHTTLYGKTNGAGQEMNLRADVGVDQAGITLFIQTTTTPDDDASWAGLNDGRAGQMYEYATHTSFYLDTTKYPTGDPVYFRAVATAPGFVPSYSNIVGIENVVNGAPPTLDIVPPFPQPGSQSGLDADHPIIAAIGTLNLGITNVVSPDGRTIKRLGLVYDGATIEARDTGASSLTTQYITSVPGDHVIKAFAIDDRGIAGFAQPVYIRIKPAGAKLVRMISPGDWSSPGNWRDENNNQGVPGPNDFAVVGSFSATLSQSITASVVSLTSGSMTGAGGGLTISKFFTVAGGQLKNLNLTINSGAIMAVVSDTNIPASGSVTNNGTVRITGRGGFVPVPNGTIAANSPASPDGFFDGVAAFFKNAGDFIVSLPKRIATAVTPPSTPPPIPLKRGVYAAKFENSGRLLSEGGLGLINQDGASVVGNSGGTIISTDGASLINQDGASIISTNGGGAISHDGSSIISQDGGSRAPLSAEPAATSADPGFIQAGGQLDLNGLTIESSITLNGGTLNGSGVIVGSLTNNGGFVAPGHSAGTISVAGDFSQGTNGTLVVEVGGKNFGQADQLQVGGTATLGGNLHVKTINGFVIDPADTFGPLGYGTASGTFNSNGGNASVTLNGNGALVSVNPSAPQPQSGQPLNIATRMSVQTGDNVLIAGFIVTGPSGSTKKVLIRGLGPSLAQFGVPGTLSDPLLELHKSDGTVTNDNWQEGDTSQIPSGFAPGDTRESVIVATLTPGNYSAAVKGAHGETGVGIAEVYDLDAASPAKLANISTRGFINTGDDVMIGGFIVGGTEPAKVLVRAIGPTLTDFGVQGALADPTLELHDTNGMTIANDDWRETQESEIIATTIPPNKDREPAILATLVPGNYTAVVRGKNNTTGVGLVEAYNLQ